MSTLRNPSASRAVVQCGRCPDAPVLNTTDPLADTDKCVRCQHRRLPEPHPDDHLCLVCRQECPRCRKPTSSKEGCRECQGKCRTCGGPVQPTQPRAPRYEFAQPEPPAQPAVITPGSSADDSDEDTGEADFPAPIRHHLAALREISPPAAEAARAAARNLYGPDASQRRNDMMAAYAAWHAATEPHNDAVAAHLAANPPPEPAPVRPPAPRRRGKRPVHRERVFVPRSTEEGQCADCLGAKENTGDPLRMVLAALPARVVRACPDGLVPQQVIATIRQELHHHPPQHLVERVAGRWTRRLAHTRIQRTEEDADSLPADRILTDLVAPGPCAARCNDGWQWDTDLRCPHCPPPPRPAPKEPADDTDHQDAVPIGPAQRTPAEAVTWRPPSTECDGRAGMCGVPVSPPYTTCPSCSGWPTCRCGTRYDPDRGCRTCTARE